MIYLQSGVAYGADFTASDNGVDLTQLAVGHRDRRVVTPGSAEVKEDHYLSMIYFRDFECEPDKEFKHLVVSCADIICAITVKHPVILG